MKLFNKPMFRFDVFVENINTGMTDRYTVMATDVKQAKRRSSAVLIMKPMKVQLAGDRINLSSTTSNHGTSSRKERNHYGLFQHGIRFRLRHHRWCRPDNRSAVSLA